MADTIHVPDISGKETKPIGICWKASPINLWRCTKNEGHLDRHTWEKP